mmetsp:Transcript_25057/g.63584  ORF Transcript_25057/g.63584 Transcript_25057/m.63584 type:complete len:217 (+) Transcript_25057:1054-1704(+)
MHVALLQRVPRERDRGGVEKRQQTDQLICHMRRWHARDVSEVQLAIRIAERVRISVHARPRAGGKRRRLDLEGVARLQEREKKLGPTEGDWVGKRRIRVGDHTRGVRVDEPVLLVRPALLLEDAVDRGLHRQLQLGLPYVHGRKVAAVLQRVHEQVRHAEHHEREIGRELGAALEGPRRRRVRTLLAEGVHPVREVGEGVIWRLAQSRAIRVQPGF